MIFLYRPIVFDRKYSPACSFKKRFIIILSNDYISKILSSKLTITYKCHFFINFFHTDYSPSKKKQRRITKDKKISFWVM